MNEEAYKDFINTVKRKIFKDGRPLYIIAPEIGITDCTLKRFLDGKGVQTFTLIQIADFYGMKLFRG